jgi:putative addiction module component (TIGR02574 family)
MAHTLDEVRQIALELPQADRRRLASSLWESVESETETGDDSNQTEINDAWDEEIEHRLAEIDSGVVQMIPMEEFFAGLEELRTSKRH